MTCLHGSSMEMTATSLQKVEYLCCSMLTLVGRLSVCLKHEAGGEECPAKMHGGLFSPRQHLVLTDSK